MYVYDGGMMVPTLFLAKMSEQFHEIRKVATQGTPPLSFCKKKHPSLCLKNVLQHVLFTNSIKETASAIDKNVDIYADLHLLVKIQNSSFK